MDEIVDFVLLMAVNQASFWGTFIIEFHGQICPCKLAHRYQVKGYSQRCLVTALNSVSLSNGEIADCNHHGGECLSHVFHELLAPGALNSVKKDSPLKVLMALVLLSRVT